MILADDYDGFVIGDIFHWEIDRNGNMWVMRNMEDPKLEVFI